jgi:hypothetical protein
LRLLQVFLNMQDRLLAQRGKSAWVKDYYMPAPCDGLVAVGEATMTLPTHCMFKYSRNSTSC